MNTHTYIQHDRSLELYVNQLKSRPDLSDPTIKTNLVCYLVTEIAPKLKKWLGSSSDTTLSECQQHLEECFRHSTSQNGYELSKNLQDNFGYNPDSNLVEDLDCVWFLKNRFLKSIEKIWVAKKNIDYPQCGSPIEAYVYDRKESKYFTKKWVSGFVAETNTELGKITVCIPEFGHVKEGVGTHGTVVNIENTRAPKEVEVA